MNFMNLEPGTQGQVNVVNLSGGKDSTATLALALATEPRGSIVGVFADTGHEHPLTYSTIERIREQLAPLPVVTVQADLTLALATRRANLEKPWSDIAPERVERAKELLQPTGSPFLDLALLKGRFPSAKARFCTTILKVGPITAFVDEIIERGHWVWSWIGMRADESPRRRFLPEFSEVRENHGLYRPLLKWRATDAIEACRAQSLPINPLYSLGMSRVGCMPCVMSNKAEIRQIALRFPEVIDRIREWEAMVGNVTRRGASTLLHHIKKYDNPHDTEEIRTKENIDAQVAWSMTSRGGTQFDLFATLDPPACESSYGLCE